MRRIIVITCLLMLVFGTSYAASVPLDSDRTLLSAKVVQETPTDTIIKAKVRIEGLKGYTVETWVIRTSDRKTMCTLWEIYTEDKFVGSVEVNIDESNKTNDIAKILQYVEDKS